MGHAVKGCPADFDATGKARWRLVKADFGEDWADVFTPTLERYLRFLAQVDEATDEIARMGGLPALITHGSQGQLVQHPLWNSYQQAQRGAADAAEALCLTPRARRRAVEAKLPPAGGRLSGRL